MPAPYPRGRHADPAALAAPPWQSGDATALYTDALSWTYRDLTELAAARGALLQALGLRPGQLVACGDGATDAEAAELVLMQHALARTGAALLPLPAGPGRRRVRCPARRHRLRMALATGARPGCRGVDRDRL